MDINNDGIDDIISGEYFGKITLYKGMKNGGVHPPVEIEQKCDPKDKKNYYKVFYSNPSFGDFNGDGLLDAFVGGAGGLRVMLNIGTKENPILDFHKPILTLDGKQVFHREVVESDFEGITDPINFKTPDYSTHIYFVDWDNDGVGDILTSTVYDHNCGSTNNDAINFHKGVKTDNGIRFDKSTPLFTATDGGKALPGSYLRLAIVDTNGDGVLDILIGVSVVTNDKGVFIPELNSYYSNNQEGNDIKEEYKKNNTTKLGKRGRIIQLLGNKHYKQK